MKRRLLQVALLLGICIAPGLTVAAQSFDRNVEKFALVIGIKGYPNFPPDERLSYTDSDAKAFRDFILTPAGGSFPEENVKLLLNGDATREGIYKKIEWLGRVTKPHDNAVVYVFFTGHGIADDEERAYLMPFDARKDSPFSTGGIRANRFLQDLEESVNARHLVLFIDACHAGAVVSADGTAKGRPNVSKEFLQTWNQSFNSAQGIHMGMLSAASNQQSYEDHGFKRGLFTHFLLLGLKGKADIRPRDGRVSAVELYKYVLNEVDQASRGRQTPIISQKFDSNLTLAIRPSLKALNPRPRYVKFFEKGSGTSTVLDVLLRTFKKRFDKGSTRYISWVLGAEVPAPGTEIKVKIKAVWHKPDGTTHRQYKAGSVSDNSTVVEFAGLGYGNKIPGTWSPGRYTVDFFLDGVRFTSGSFEVTDSSAEQATPSPYLTFWSLNPKLNFVKLFGIGKGPIPPKAERKYSKQFWQRTTRFIHWELDVMAAPGKEFDFKIDTVWYGPDGAVLWRESVPTHINKDWKGVNRIGPGYGWADAGKWKLGRYKVEFVVDKKVIASETFEIIAWDPSWWKN